ncbi:hypothetical protein ACFLZH_06050, partial [Patescibacteria group bacterium]
EVCGIGFAEYLEELGKGKEHNLQLTEEKLGREICKFYINAENDKERGRARFNKKGKKFFEKLWEHLGANEMAPN